MYENGIDGPVDYTEAMKCYRAIIDKETPDYRRPTGARARTKIGRMYGLGQGVEQNDAEAFKWFKAAAMRGEDEAKIQIGLMLWKGIGTNKDVEEAKEWLEAAVRHPYYGKGALYFLAKIYHQQKNAETAFEYLHASATAKDYTSEFVLAQYQLGCFYRDGIGVTANPEEAKKWFEKAAKSGFTEEDNIVWNKIIEPPASSAANDSPPETPHAERVTARRGRQIKSERNP